MPLTSCSNLTDAGHSNVASSFKLTLSNRETSEMTANYLKSVNLKGTTSLFTELMRESILKLLILQRTPMLVLFFSSLQHHLVAAHRCLPYPVASAGCVNRPHPLGVGSFKLQLRQQRLTSCFAAVSCTQSELQSKREINVLSGSRGELL
jgi:hypothetical protein